MNALKKEDMSFGMSKLTSKLLEDTHVIVDDKDGLDEPKKKIQKHGDFVRWAEHDNIEWQTTFRWMI